MRPDSLSSGERAGALLSTILRGLRRHRGLKAPEVALRMGMPLRSYQHFEGGHEKNPSLDRIVAFAEATDSDPYAILMALQAGAPDLALRSADNKLMLVFQLALEQFHRRVAGQIERLDAATLLAAFDGMFEDLAAEARRREALVTGLGRGRTETPHPDTED